MKALLFYIALPVVMLGLKFSYQAFIEAYDGFLYDTQGSYTEVTYDWLTGEPNGKIIHVNPKFHK